MNKFRITIRLENRPVHKPVAWYISGSRADKWLEEVGQWGVSLSRLTFYSVPMSISDRRPRGALVIVDGGATPAVTPRVVPYGQLAGKLYLPVDAGVWPPVTDEELKSLFGPDMESYVWHPASGLTGFESGAGLRAEQLLRFPLPSPTDWSVARPGTAFNTRLWSVEPEAIPRIDEILEAGRGDIGSLAPDISELPPSPDESTLSELTGLAGKMVEGAARAGLWLSGLIPHVGTAETWVNRLESKLQGLVQNAMRLADLNSARSRELQRLLHLLKNDPDQGLKFALPFGGDSYRGPAPPSGLLSSREVNFNLSRLGRGGPADFWNVPFEVQQKLLEEYRRLANRELHLGRHRRAAYIFAELLADLPASAGALVAGQHYREVAVLYKERLKQPLEAAKCLEQGRLWAEALQLYAELAEFEKAGDLATRLEQDDEATRYYREAERVARTRNDYITAARLLELKLSASDEAADCLIAGCKSPYQGRQCLGELFRLFARLGRHDAAFELVHRFREEPESRVADDQFAGELAGVAQTYPDEPVRAMAADSVRIVVAARLSQAPPDERRTLLHAVKSLAPEDRLLERDCRRYLDSHSRAMSRIAAAATRRIPEVTFIREYRLPEHVHWVTATSTDSWFYAAGYRDRELIVARGNWNEPVVRDIVEWPVPPARTSFPVLLLPDPQETSPHLFVFCLAGPPLAPRVWSGQSGYEPNSHLISPAWISDATIASGRGSTGVSWELKLGNGPFTVTSFNARHTPLATLNLDIPDALRKVVFLGGGDNLFPAPLQVGESATYIGLGKCLAIVRPTGAPEFLEMPQEIRGLNCAVPHTRNRIAITFETGGQVFWDEPGRRKFEWFASSLSSPQAVFTQRGWLVAASSEECQVYSTNDGRIQLAAAGRWTDRTMLALLKTSLADEFALCCADGRVLTYRIPPRV